MINEDKKLPWFKLYANDFLARTVGLTNEQVGIYVKLLTYTWAYGPQPPDLNVINSIVQGGEATALVLARYFESDERGKLYEPSLEALRNESLEVADANRKRTAAATAKRTGTPLRERHDDVSSIPRGRNDDVTRTESESESESESKVKINPEPQPQPITRAVNSLVEIQSVKDEDSPSIADGMTEAEERAYRTNKAKMDEIKRRPLPQTA